MVGAEDGIGDCSGLHHEPVNIANNVTIRIGLEDTYEPLDHGKVYAVPSSSMNVVQDVYAKAETMITQTRLSVRRTRFTCIPQTRQERTQEWRFSVFPFFLRIRQLSC